MLLRVQIMNKDEIHVMSRLHVVLGLMPVS